MPKSEAAKSFFGKAMLQMRNGQRTDAISETAVFIKFKWIHIDMKTNFLRNKAATASHILPNSERASMMYWDNQNKYVWGKDRQEDLLELFNESIDRVNLTADESV